MKLLNLLFAFLILSGSSTLSATPINAEGENRSYLLAQNVDPAQMRDRVDRIEKKDSVRKNESAASAENTKSNPS